MENNLEIDELSSGIMTSCRIFQNIYTISTATTKIHKQPSSDTVLWFSVNTKAALLSSYCSDNYDNTKSTRTPHLCFHRRLAPTGP